MSYSEGSAVSEVGARIRVLRRARGWSARELAERCQANGASSLTRSTIAKIESGIRTFVTVDEVRALAHVFDVAELTLMGTDEPASDLGLEITEETGPWTNWTGSAAGFEPVTVERLIATHILQGQAVIDSTTERWITSLVDDVDRYTVQAWSGAGSDIQVQPLLNCTAGEMRTVDIGSGLEARTVEMIFPQKLMTGDQVFFASRVLYQDPDPWSFAEVQVTTRGIRDLALRIQFDLSMPLPRACWYYSEMPDIDSHIPPPAGSDHYASISGAGFVEKRFTKCKPGAKYGLHWVWP